MESSRRLTLILLIVATAAVSSLVTLVLAPTATVQAQSGLRTTRAPAGEADATPPAAAGGAYSISAYAFSDPPANRREEPKWTMGFYVINQQTGKVGNCMYMWSGEHMKKCTTYPWVTLP